jgi:MFS family permease
MSRPYYSKDARVERSLRHSVRDGVSYSMMAGAGETYLSAYALFLKASTAQISLLTALPSLLGSLAQVLSAWLAGFVPHRKKLILSGVLVQALMWLPMIWLPYFFPRHAVTIVISCVAIYYAAGNFVIPAWNSLMGDLVPERKRGRFFARRTQLMSIMSFLSLAGAGLLLHFLELTGETRLGFTIGFSLAASARLYSAYHLSRMHEPARAPIPMTLPQFSGLWKRLRTSDFARFTSVLGMMNFSVAIASPFFTVYMLRDLNFTYLQYSASTGISVLAQFLTLNMWGRFGDIFGHRRVMVLTGSVIPILPALWLVSPEFWYILGVQTLGGLCWAGFSLSAGNFLYDVMPSDRRSTYAAIHNVLSNSAIFSGALVGGYFSTVIPAEFMVWGHRMHWTSGLWGVILISAVARASVALIYLRRIHEVREVRPVSAGGLMIRVIRFNALAELVIDLLGAQRRRRRTRLLESNQTTGPG